MVSTADSQEVDHSEQRDELIQDEQISFDETPTMLSSPPVPPPPPPLWHSNLHRTNWAAPHNIHRSVILFFCIFNLVKIVNLFTHILKLKYV